MQVTVIRPKNSTKRDYDAPKDYNKFDNMFSTKRRYYSNNDVTPIVFGKSITYNNTTPNHPNFFFPELLRQLMRIAGLSRTLVGW